MTILITRPLPDGKKLVSMLHAVGIKSYFLSLIKFRPGVELKKLLNKINKLKNKDMIFSLSKQAIYYANVYLNKNNITWPSFVKYYAIGPKTGSILHKYSGHNIVYPEKKYNTEKLISLLNIKEIRNKSAIILQNKYGRTLLQERLINYGVKVNKIECYEIIFNKIDHVKIGKKLKENNIKTLVITSGLILKQFYKIILISEKNKWILNCKIIVVSNRLANLAFQLGWNNIKIIHDISNEKIFNTLIK
ncbi:uroporphyrinogen-III synthase [Buchnera aphidicola (Pemphigus obesinymphae)]|uniref:uroporphyrinogen-III synthase n=1 Tax=Buchnera aphidicola TaxID=9 RepID=UPI002237ABC0|nr:uroporphyrinogen-III synthase [Buchnera aphidicola]MCW5196732.1 uroporphyrinogen-III synthase [Buchnera aphidicola (Pemphigus obesinymphae)]